MQSAFDKALQLILTADKELCDILSVTARMSLSSSIIALLIGQSHGPLQLLVFGLGVEPEAGQGSHLQMFTCGDGSGLRQFQSIHQLGWCGTQYCPQYGPVRSGCKDAYRHG